MKRAASRLGTGVSAREVMAVEVVERAEVTVVEARGLSGDALSGKRDPYCIIQVERQSERTSKIKKTLAPRWNEKYSVSEQRTCACNRSSHTH